MKKNILSLGLVALCATMSLTSCLNNDTPAPRPLTPEEARTQHIATCMYRFGQQDNQKRYYWERKMVDGKETHVMLDLLLDTKQTFTILQLDDASQLPAVDESKGIIATGKLMDDAKPVLFRASKTSDNKPTTAEQDKKLYWAITTQRATLDEKAILGKVPAYTSSQGENRWLTDAVCVKLTKAENLEILKWYAGRLLLDIVAQSPTDPLLYIVSSKYIKYHPLLIAEILYRDREVFADAYPFFYKEGWSLYAPTGRP